MHSLRLLPPAQVISQSNFVRVGLDVRQLETKLRACEETLRGENKYNTRDPKLGRQEAKRAVRFKSLPPVLQLHLKRFEYDFESGSMHKLQQEFSFPTRLKLQRYMAKGGEANGKAKANKGKPEPKKD